MMPTKRRSAASQAQAGALALTLANPTNQGATTAPPQSRHAALANRHDGRRAERTLAECQCRPRRRVPISAWSEADLFPPGATAPAKRQQRIQAITDDFASNFGRRDHARAAKPMYADNPTEYDTAIRLAQTANKPNAAELADTKNRQEFGTFQALFPNRPEAKTYNAKTDYAKLGTGLMEQAKAQAAGGGHYTFPVGTDAEGKPGHYAREYDDGRDCANQPSGEGRCPGGSAQAQQSPYDGGGERSAVADRRMRTYEDGLLSGHTTISPLEQDGRIVDDEPLLGRIRWGAQGRQAVTEATLNANDPRLRAISPRCRDHWPCRTNDVPARRQ